MNLMKEMGDSQHLEKVKALAGLLMRKHYCEHDAEWITKLFAPRFSWFGPGESEYIVGREACIKRFLEFKETIPDCDISDEQYDAICAGPGVYVVTGRLWVATAPETEMYLKVHQRLSCVFQDMEDGLKCTHIHCSNPYQEMMDGEQFPNKIGRQSYDYVQERIASLEAETKQQNRQLEVIMTSVAGGLKISNDDEVYSYAFVSREAAALFGYTVEEFMEATGGSAAGNVYPPDLERALAECAEAFKDGGLTYSIRYRVRCRDGSLKWIIDSGKKAQDTMGNWMVNSLYLDITKSEEDAQRLREQTQLLTSIYDTVPCGIIRFLRRRDGSYPLISLNHATLSMMGYENLEEGMNDWLEGTLGTVLPEDREGLMKTYLSLNTAGDRTDSEYRVRCKDGSIHWMEGTSMIVGITSHGDAILQRTVVDITQRKMLQQRLSREQEMYRVAMEASSAVMFEYLIDTDTFISYEPRTGQGVLRNELLNYSKLLKDQNLVHPDDVPTVIDNICNGRAEVFEVRFSTPEEAGGDYIWFRVNSRLIMADGRPGRVVGALHNIHSMKSELSENSERLHMSQSALLAVNGVYASIFYVNLREDSYYAVRMPEAQSGEPLPRTGRYSTELRTYLLEDVGQADFKRVAEICAREHLLCGQHSESEPAEVEFRHKRSALWLRMEIHLTGRTERNAIIALRNISAEKQKELEYYEEEKKAKQALEEAYESLSRANQAKSDFLSRMSHDIRTPMNAILGMTAIAQNSLGNDQKIMDCLSKISLSGSHLLELINGVLDMSKIENGDIGLTEDRFRLDSLLKEVSEIVRTDLERKCQHLKVHVKNVDHEAVYGDAVRMKQILINLLSNSIKYTSKGGSIHVYLEEKLSSDSGVGCFEFVVEDNGIGMSQEFLEKLFLPFERAEDSRVSQIQGTGLGLAITRNLVEMMNGGIRVESRINRGTRIFVTIFFKLVQCGETVKDRTVPDAPSLHVEFPAGTKVLLAEDNLLNREIVVELLSMWGIGTVCAANGQEAVERFCADRPGTYGLILMDIQMPVMDGYEASKAIRRLGETGQRPDAARIPIIALTANAFADDVYKAKQAGMNEHVKKPLELDRLLESMHRWLD